MLILLRGKPGTGKSTLANALGRRLRAAVIDKDDIKDVLDRRYRDEHVGGLTYEVMLRIADRCLSQGIHVICDSPLTFPDLHRSALEIAARHGVPVKTVRLRCLDEWRRRVESRRGQETPEHRVTSFDDPQLFHEEGYGIADELVIDTSKPIEEVVEAVLSFCAAVERQAAAETT
jgi:predicted kinase